MNKRQLVRAVLPVTVACVILFPLLCGAIHDPPGTQANSGIVYSGDVKMFAVVENANPAIWLYSVNEYTGAMDVKGHSLLGGYNLDYYCMIKISPADYTHKYLMLKTSCDFYYGMSAGWFAGAAWWLRYTVFDMNGYPIRCVGWTQWYKSVSVSWGGYLDNQYYHTLDTYYPVYRDLDRWVYYYEFSPSYWYYVGIWLRLSLTNAADIYKTSYGNGLADWNVYSISWMFFE